jgi:hypothetical protein
MATLVGIDGAGAGASHALSRALILGRQKGVDVLVDDIGASREHAKVFQQDGDYFVIDLNSRNGTKVNGQTVSRHRLKHGDLITIGKSGYRFDAPEVAARAPAAPPPAPAAPPASASPSASAGAAAKGPSAIEKERERLRAEASKKTSSNRPAADDGSGIVIRETVLQYGRVENKGGLLGEDIGQRAAPFKILIALVMLAVCGGIVWGIVKALDKEPVDEEEPPPADTGEK